MQIILCRSNKIGSLAIRGWTWSTWSHCGILDHQGKVIEAKWPKVCRTNLSDVLMSHTDYEIRDIPCTNPDGVIHAALSQIDKPYDWTALAGFAAHRNWQEDDSWFCSELLAWSFAAAGCPIIRAEFMHRILPDHIAMLPSRLIMPGPRYAFREDKSCI